MTDKNQKACFITSENSVKKTQHNKNRSVLFFFSSGLNREDFMKILFLSFVFFCSYVILAFFFLFVRKLCFETVLKVILHLK